MSLNKFKRWKYIFVGSCLFIVFLILGTCTGGILSPFPFLYLDSFHGKVIDAKNQEPIPGAAVLAVYYKTAPGVAGSVSSAVDAQETMTDGKGEFHIPIEMRWFSLHRGFTEGRLIIFKPGYGAFPSHANSKEVKEATSTGSEKSNMVYELPKLKSNEEKIANLPLRPDVPYEKMKHIVRLISEERIGLGMRPLTIPK